MFAATMRARWLAAAVALLAVGLAAGWFAVAWPFDDDSSGDVATRLLKRLRESPSEADDATCRKRQATDDQYLCTVLYGLSSGAASDARTFLVTDHGGTNLSIHSRP